jgi:hypothetical protein
MGVQLTHQEMLALMEKHDAAEAVADVAGTMATVSANPCWEFHPLGYYIRGREALTEMYNRMLHSQADAVKGAVRKNFWFNDEGYVVEFEFDIVTVDGKPHKSHVVVAFQFEDGLVQAERVFMGTEHAEVVRRALGEDFINLPGVEVVA